MAHDAGLLRSVPAFRSEPHAHHGRDTFGEFVGVHRPVGLGEHGEDHQAERLVGIVLRHAAKA